MVMVAHPCHLPRFVSKFSIFLLQHFVEGERICSWFARWLRLRKYRYLLTDITQFPIRHGAAAESKFIFLRWNRQLDHEFSILLKKLHSSDFSKFSLKRDFPNSISQPRKLVTRHLNGRFIAMILLVFFSRKNIFVYLCSVDLVL